MITVVYDTRTGLGKKFAEKLDCLFNQSLMGLMALVFW